MSRDSEELLYKNQFTKRPVPRNISPAKSTGFENYMKKQIEDKTKQLILDKINKDTLKTQPKSKQINDYIKGKTATPFNYGVTSYGKFDTGSVTSTSLQSVDNVDRYKKEKITIVSVDSSNRNTYEYPDANSFTINLGKTFFNVKSIRLISSEFPNSERVVKDSTAGDAQNNVIKWINEEDDQFAIPLYLDTTIYYPYKPYSTELNTGNYSLNSIDDEMVSKLNNNIRRLEGDGEPHFFVVETNNDNGIISMSSYFKFNLNSVNPVSTVYTSGQDTENKSFFISLINHNIKDNTYDIYGSQYPDWDPSVTTTWVIGDVARYNNVLYECTETYTTTPSDLNPAYNQSKWKRYFYQPNILYISGLQSVGGIPSTDMNGVFSNFKVVSPNKIQVYTNVSCSFTDAGGGNSGIVGVSKPYQLLFNDEQHNIGRVLGFPQENSSDYIPEAYLTTTTFSIKDMTPGTKTTIYTQVVYVGKSISVSSGGEVTITTSVPHNLITGDQITIQNSDCVPSIDSFITDNYLDQNYYTVTYVSDTSFKISPGFDVVTEGFFCNINFPNGDNQLVSNTVIDVSDLTPDTNPLYTIVTTSSAHGLSAGQGFLLLTNSISNISGVLPATSSNFIVVSVIDSTNFTIQLTIETTFSSPILVSKIKYGGDKIRFDNSLTGVFSTPKISGIFLVEDATPTSFTIDFETTFIDQTTIKFGVIQSDVITIYHPNHPFNRLVRNDLSFKFDVGYNRLVLQEDSGNPFYLIYPTGIYTTANISAYLGSQLSSLSPNGRTYTCSFSGNIFTLSVSSGTFKILGTKSNILTGLGIDQVDTSLASSHSGKVLNGIRTYLLPHNAYGQYLLILNIKQSVTATESIDIWVGKQESTTYTGDGATVNYTMPYVLIYPEVTEVYVNGVLKTAGVDYNYTLYSDIITFTAAPALGDSIEIKSIITTNGGSAFFGDGVTTIFQTTDDIINSALLSVEVGGVPQVLGVDYTITLPRTITFTIAPVSFSLVDITNIVNDSTMTKNKPRCVIGNAFVYTGILPNPISTVYFDGTYDTVDIPNVSTIRITSATGIGTGSGGIGIGVITDITGYTFAGADPLGPGQPYLYNSSLVLETNLFDYESHSVSTVPVVTDSNSIEIPFFNPWGVDTILGAGNYFKIYRVKGIPTNTDNLVGISLDKLNGNRFNINKIINKDFYNFKISDQYAYTSTYTPSSQIYLSSYKNGFYYKQDNTGSGVASGLGSGPYNALKLSGNNYVFLRSPGLETITNTNLINDVFAKILLSEPPGNIIFDSFVSNAKIFDESPLAKLEKIQFIVTGSDGFAYDFNKNDFSFSLEIIEYVDSLKNTGISSRTGSVDTSGHLNAIYTSDFDKRLVETTTGN